MAPIFSLLGRKKKDCQVSHQGKGMVRSEAWALPISDPLERSWGVPAFGTSIFSNLKNDRGRLGAIFKTLCIWVLKEKHWEDEAKGRSLGTLTPSSHSFTSVIFFVGLGFCNFGFKSGGKII